MHNQKKNCSTKTNVVGTQKNRLNERVLMSTKHMLKQKEHKKISTFLCFIFFSSQPVQYSRCELIRGCAVIMVNAVFWFTAFLLFVIGTFVKIS